MARRLPTVIKLSLSLSLTRRRRALLSLHSFVSVRFSMFFFFAGRGLCGVDGRVFQRRSVPATHGRTADDGRSPVNQSAALTASRTINQIIERRRPEKEEKPTRERERERENGNRGKKKCRNKSFKAPATIEREKKRKTEKEKETKKEICKKK